MIRRLFTAASAMSLVLCAGATTLWVRSQTTADWIQWISDIHKNDPQGSGLRRAVSYAAQTTPSRLTVARWQCLLKAGEAGGYRHNTAAAGEEEWRDLASARWFGSEYINAERAEVWVSLPFWFVATMCALLSGSLYGFRRPRVPSPDHCRNCGYDLRASTDRCPECGAPITAKS